MTRLIFIISEKVFILLFDSDKAMALFFLLLCIINSFDGLYIAIDCWVPRGIWVQELE